MKYLRILLTLCLLGTVHRSYADDFDKLLSKIACEAMREQYSIALPGPMVEATRAIFADVVRAANAVTSLPPAQNLETVTVIVSNDVNAYALPDGQVFITTGATGLEGMNGDEVAAILAHEISHVRRKHGLRSLKEKLGLGILGQLIDKKERIWAALASELFTAGRSRSDEQEADRDALAILKKTSFRQTAPLAFFRRVETLSPKDTNSFSQLFATHPAPSERSLATKNWLLANQYGWDYRVVDVAKAADRSKTSVEFANDDPAWQDAYTKATGWEIYHLPNRFSKLYHGECTWLAWALRKDEIPLKPTGNNAEAWLETCRNAGYAVGPTPKPGALIVWDKSVAKGYGHVGMVTQVISPTLIVVWDSNWGPEANDSIYTNGRVRERVMTPDNRVAGYIYWPNGQADAPEGYPGYLEAHTPRQQLMIIGEAFRLGDSGPGAEMIRSAVFELSATEVSRSQSAVIRFKMRSEPRKDPIVSINRQEIGRVTAKSEEWETCELAVPSRLLRPGKNLLDMETFIPHIDSGYDDCEVKEVELLLR